MEDRLFENYVYLEVIPCSEVALEMAWNLPQNLCS